MDYCHSVSLEWNGHAFCWHEVSELLPMIPVLRSAALVLKHESLAKTVLFTSLDIGESGDDVWFYRTGLLQLY